jgi:hypothetical protein
MRQIKNYKQIFIVLFILLAIIKCNAQSDSNWVLKFTCKHSTLSKIKDSLIPGQKVFYLYENVNYNLQLKDGMVYSAVINKIMKDSISFITHLDKSIAILNHQHFDTITISPHKIKIIKLIGDRSLGLYENIRLKKYTYEFLKENESKKFSIDTITEDSVKYKLVISATSQGMETRYINIESNYKADTGNIEDTSKLKIRNFIWLSDLKAKQINGLALGLFGTGNLLADNKQKINGINVNTDVITMFVTIFKLFSITENINTAMLSDSMIFEGKTTITGLSTSLGGVMEGRKLNGIFLNGGSCVSDEAHGIQVSGIENHFQSIKGISIAGIKNTSTKCKGIQIGLINTCKHLKGVQIGLWNVNSKRKLPFINWGT